MSDLWFLAKFSFFCSWCTQRELLLIFNCSGVQDGGHIAFSIIFPSNVGCLDCTLLCEKPKEMSFWLLLRMRWATGEPIPVPKGPGDAVRAGTLSTGDGGAVRVRATATGAQSVLASVIALVEDAQVRCGLWPVVSLPVLAVGAGVCALYMR